MLSSGCATGSAMISPTNMRSSWLGTLFKTITGKRPAMRRSTSSSRLSGEWLWELHGHSSDGLPSTVEANARPTANATCPVSRMKSDTCCAGASTAALSAVCAAERREALLRLGGLATRRVPARSWIASTALTDCAITKALPGATSVAPLPRDGPDGSWCNAHDDLNPLRRQTCCDD